MKKFIRFFLTPLMLSSCAPTIDSRGYNSEAIDLSKIQIGTHNQQHVQETLGSPSSISAFKEPVWYYVSKTTSTTSFFTPTTLEQQVIAITFDHQGIVKDVKKIKGDESIAIKPIERKTETTGYESGMFREVFSNFGRRLSNKPTKSQ